MFSYNSNTIKAMEETNYTLISGISEFHQKGWISEKIQSIPATIELCDFSNNSWKMKSKETISSELKLSIEKFGYAIIVTHPQEFLTNNDLDLEIANHFEKILHEISKNYGFNTINNLI
jgi:hypothetical protein